MAVAVNEEAVNEEAAKEVEVERWVYQYQRIVGTVGEERVKRRGRGRAMVPLWEDRPLFREVLVQKCGYDYFPPQS